MLRAVAATACVCAVCLGVLAGYFYLEALDQRHKAETAQRELRALQADMKTTEAIAFALTIKAAVLEAQGCRVPSNLSAQFTRADQIEREAP